jgi:hypothetical protein
MTEPLLTLPLLPMPAWLAAAAETALKRSLIHDVLTTGGSADAHDAQLVGRELERLPVEALQLLKDNGIKVVACRGSITDHRAELKGVHPRGWPPGMTWDNVPAGRVGNEVVVAVTGHGTAAGAHVPATGEGHGSQNVVIHEGFHALDGDGAAARSSSAEFTAARNADLGTLSAYEKQAGVGGPRETFAESAARYYGGDPNDAASHPHLNAYWATHPLQPKP